MTDEALRRETLKTVARFIREVIGEDWAEELDIGEDTSFASDLELESIEFVALAEKMQGRYGDQVDFVRWLSEKQVADILRLRVGDVVEFIVRCQTSGRTA